MRVWRVIAALAVFVLFAEAARAQIIDDRRRQHVTLTPKLAGIHNLQPGESWYRVDVADTYIGYTHITVQAAGGNVIYSEHIRIKMNMYFDNYDFVVTCDQGTLKPLKATLFKEGRYYKTYRKIEKSFVFDWDHNKIIVITGEGANARSRGIPMQQNAVYTPHWFFALHKRELLVPGTEYQFQTFDFDYERYFTLGVNILGETKKDVFEIFVDLPDAYGTAFDMRYWISPKTIANPNGEFIRKEWIGEFMQEPMTMVQTTKEKAINQTTGTKNKDKKK